MIDQVGTGETDNFGATMKQLAAIQYGNMETRETIMEPFNKGFFSDDLKTFNVCYIVGYS